MTIHTVTAHHTRGDGTHIIGDGYWRTWWPTVIGPTAALIAERLFDTPRFNWAAEELAASVGIRQSGSRNAPLARSIDRLALLLPGVTVDWFLRGDDAADVAVGIPDAVAELTTRALYRLPARMRHAHDAAFPPMVGAR